MPYIEGETLRDKLDRETQLGIDEAVKITTEIADALDYAHRHNVIHRDIKPENILLHDGRPMVADFGIALAVSAAAGGRMTETGMSLGTPHYMSPEQATADREITNRSDIYSLGSVLYEMLTGEPPHMGNSAQQIIMKIVTDQARPVSELRKSVPPNVAAAIPRSLEKLPADRFATARDFIGALATPGFQHAVATAAAVASTTPRLNGLIVALGMSTMILAVLLAWALGMRQQAPSTAVARFDITPRTDPERMLGAIGGPGFALSADGSRLVYVGQAPDGGTQLWQRLLESLEPVPIPGTAGGTYPALSPDGQIVAFVVGPSIQTVSLPDGPPFTVAEGSDPTWGADGALYFVQGQVIHRVPPGGGESEAMTEPMGADQIQPAPLPGGGGLLLTIRRSIASQSRIAVVGPDGGAPREILDGTKARYAKSGHVIYTTADGTLLGAPFDFESLEPGPPVPLISNVLVGGSSHTAFAISASGALLYYTDIPPPDRELVWVNRVGDVIEYVDPDWLGGFSFPTLSPDGSRLAVALQGDLWVKHLNGTPAARLTFETDPQNFHATWTPDGDSLVLDGATELLTRRADGSGQTVLTTTNDRGAIAPRWSPAGMWLVYRTNLNFAGSGDILAIRPGQDSVPTELVATAARELSPAISPDGRWMAYSSDETGQHEVYVVAFPDAGGGRWAVSDAGGVTPQWSHSGRELFYRDRQGAMVAVAVRTVPTFSVGASRILFENTMYSVGGLHAQFVVAPDDRRFLMIRNLPQEGERQLILVQNFFEELKAKVGN
jgi:serine/threonine-protein kinase